MAAPPPLLELDRLSTHYVSAQGRRVVRAVDEVSLRVDAGDTLGIVGESGSGKSTLALSLLRVLPPAARIVGGRILFDGEDLVAKIRGRDAANSRQEDRDDPAGPDGLAEPVVHDRQPGGRADPGARAGEPAYRRAAGARPVARRCGFRRRRCGSSNTHTRCRAACGSGSSVRSAISCEPRLLIADEPTTSLDLTIQAQYLNLLARAAAGARPRPDFHHPQSRHRRQDVRPARRHVCRAGGRVRSGLAHFQRARASLYPRRCSTRSREWPTPISG